MKHTLKKIMVLILIICSLFGLYKVDSIAYNALEQDASVYGETPFTKEYSLGYFCINNSIQTGCEIIDEDDGWWLSGTWYGTTSTVRNQNIYIDHYNSAYMNGEYYDIREYIYVENHEDWIVTGTMAISKVNGEISCQNLYKGIREFHFYKSGHCGDSNHEVEFKGIIQLTDFDIGEGYTINNVNRAYLTNPTNITLEGYNTWLGNVNDSGNWDMDTLWAEIYGNANNPLILTYWGNVTHGGGINFNGTDLSGTITYKANGGTGNDIVQIVSLGYKNQLYENGYSNNGEFICWNTDPNGNGDSYEAGKEYTINQSMILYAIWDYTTTTVTFNRNDGTGETASQSFTSGNSGNRFGYNTDGSLKWGNSGQFGAWDRAGYTLLGWSENSTATSKTYDKYSWVSDEWINAKNPSVNLYAVWKEATYTINNTAGIGGIISNNCTGLQYGDTTSVFIIAKSGYKIKSVSVDGVNKGAISTYDFWNVSSDHTVIATFERTTTFKEYMGILAGKYSWIAF